MKKCRVSPELFRIVDANLNRSREGLRVCEDIARFVMASPAITKNLKRIRHSISEMVGAAAIEANLLGSRDAAGDLGRRLKPESEMRRCDFADIFAANIERVKESLRVLEEFFKLIDKRLSLKCATLRFKVYEIEKKALKRFSFQDKYGVRIK